MWFDVLLAFNVGVLVGWMLFPMLEREYHVIDRDRILRAKNGTRNG